MLSDGGAVCGLDLTASAALREQVYGMSADKPKSLASWKEKQSLRYSLLSAPDEVCPSPLLFSAACLFWCLPWRLPSLGGLHRSLCAVCSTAA